jgi:yersiniabactin nonribosomal peptide synthetase
MPDIHGSPISAALDSFYDTIGHELALELQIKAPIDKKENLLQLGLDSMRLMKWLHYFRKQGYPVTLKELYQSPSLVGWKKLLEQKSDQASRLSQRITPMNTQWPTMHSGQPFELTPVQHAYLIGRSPQQTLGGVGCHLYQEFDGEGLNPKQLELAIKVLIEYHPMLKVCFRSDGYQQYRSSLCWRGVTIHNLKNHSTDECESYLQLLRENLGHRVLDVELGETFDIQLSLLPKGRHRVHVNIDLLIMDAASFTLFFDQLNRLLSGQSLPPQDKTYDFCSYLAQQRQENKSLADQSKHYWQSHLQQLPPAPVLPLALEPDSLTQVRITRNQMTIGASRWDRFTSHAGRHGVTPTMVLVTCFSAVLARWGGLSRLLLNLTLFDRQPFHPAVETMLADFTSILLLDIHCHGKSVIELARENQQTFAEAYDHRHWSGVELLRELKKTQDYPQGTPIVFTSNLGRPLFGDHPTPPLGKPAWGISQTPQVWIDHLTFEHQDQVILQWDSNQELFPPELIQTLFNTYTQQINTLIDNPQAWFEPFPDFMPIAQKTVRRQVNETRQPVPDGLLHNGFFKQAQQQPDAIALISGQHQWCYGELAEKARRGAGTLISRGIKAGETVAVSMAKGPGQIVAVLSILQVGAVYVPVSLDQPDERRLQIYTGAQVKLTLTCADDHTSSVGSVPHLTWQEAIQGPDHSTDPELSPTQPAYIIYTSGSTGTPKGVIISHRGALNTCHALNQRCRISRSDRVLALSALHFDLSVYDIFGMLSAGAAIVLPQESQRRDPDCWCDLIQRYQITIWNSVPALFDMLLTYSEGFQRPAPSTLRVVMLSGDWIGLDLPARYRAFRHNGQLVAMGGATEASIWSNAYDVDVVPDNWRSIPYGYPLSNQFYRVVDEQRNDCPDWVVGELWIGGEGVALGYFNDPQRTAEQFVTVDEERWYRTGDMGCYWPDGTLEFLGRRDKQVKVGGYRIELGEIEAAIQRIPSVKQGVVLALGGKEKKLVAFVTPAGDALLKIQLPASGVPDNYAQLHHSLPTVEIDDHETELDTWVCDFLFEHLAYQGLDLSQPHTAADLIEQYGVSRHWHCLFVLWLDVLVRHQRLKKHGQGVTATFVKCKAPQMPAYLNVTSGKLRPIADALVTYHEILAPILRDQRTPQTLLEHPIWAPESLASYSIGSPELTEELSRLIQALSHRLGRTVQVIELGARSAVSAKHLLEKLSPEIVQYTVLDESQEMVLRASDRLKPWATASARRWQPEVPADLSHRADLIWLNHALHRYTDQQAVLDTVRQLAAPAALCYLTEFAQASPLALISTRLLTEKPAHPLSLRSPEQWQQQFEQAGFTLEARDHVGKQYRFMLRCPTQVQQPDTQALHQALSEQLPEYMLPKQLFILEALPLTANGKIDRKHLQSYCQQEASPPVTDAPPQGQAEQAVATLWYQLLGEANYQRHSDFFQAGGDSLLATRLISALEQQGYQARLSDLFDYPTLAAFAATLGLRDRMPEAQLSPDPDAHNRPFALTEVQQAYWVGRQKGFTLGGIGSQFFVEFEVDQLDVAQLEQIWNRLIERHDILRAVIRDGQQQVLAHVPRYIIKPYSIVDKVAALALREKLAYQVRDPATWPVCDLQVAVLPNGSSYIYLCLDNLLLDGLSMQILMAELEQDYLYPDRIRPPLAVTFRDYRQYMAQQTDNQSAKDYWMQRIDTLPPAPQLPLVRAPETIQHPRFIRLSARLPAAQWQRLKTQAKQVQLTPSTLLLAAYATVLSAWSQSPSLSLNLTLFDRHPVHPQINQVLGDFTSLLLLAWQPEHHWLDSAQVLQRRLWQDLAHRDVSAIWVMRQLARRRQLASTSMPVVFTSALGFEGDRFLARRSWLKPHWGISQTPQIWLDHQVYESEGELCFNWDAVEALFDPQQLEAMFNAYTNLLKRLATCPQDWTLPLTTLVPQPMDQTFPSRMWSTESPLSPSKETHLTDPRLTRLICDEFQKVAESPIHATQNFFDAGATSLMLVQLHIRLQQHNSIQSAIAVTDLFAYPSPTLLASHLNSSTSPPQSLPDKRHNRLTQRQQHAQRRRKQRNT